VALSWWKLWNTNNGIKQRRPVALSWWKLWNTNNGIKRNFEAWLHGRQDCPELTTMDRKGFQTGLG